MIVNKPDHMYEWPVETPKPELPAVEGMFKKEEAYAPNLSHEILEVREVSFVPGFKVLGFLLLVVGGVFAVKPADGTVPTTFRPFAVSCATVGLAIILWKRSIRTDAIYR